MLTEDFIAKTKMLLRAYSWTGKMSVGFEENAPLMKKLLSSGEDWSIFRHNSFVGYIKDGQLIWLDR